MSNDVRNFYSPYWRGENNKLIKFYAINVYEEKKSFLSSSQKK